MGRNRNKWLLLVCAGLFTGFISQAQSSRYIVYFTDKAESPFSVERPEEFLSPRALQRRARHQIIIDEKDIPVNPAYLQALSSTGAEVYHTSKWMNLALVQCKESQLSKIGSLPFVKSTELAAPGARLTLGGQAASGNGGSSLESGRTLSSMEFQNNLLSADDMHKRGLMGQGVLISIFDGGFSGADTVPFFEKIREEGRILQTYDFVTNGKLVYYSGDHGTKVFSTIGAEMMTVNDSDTTFTLGVAPHADFALFITEDVKTEYNIEEYNWLFAAEKADSLGADIIHSSVGYNTFNDSRMNYEYEQMDGNTAISTRAAGLAADKGLFVVVSVGNEGNNRWQKMTAPADSPKVLAVGAIDGAGRLAGFSSMGPTADGRIKPDVVALGAFATVGSQNGSIVNASGTSFSAPMVAGLVAGIIQARPELTTARLLDNVRHSGNRSTHPDTLFGYGIPDFLRAVGESTLSVNDVINDKIKVYPNPFTENTLFIRVNHPMAAGGLSVVLFDANGKLIMQKKYDSYSMDDVLTFEFDSAGPGMYFLQLSSTLFEKQVKLLRY